MARIFVSYKRLNKDQVFPLVEKIEQQVGEKCWVDLEGIESSVQFASVICRAIDNADVVLFMHSSMHLSIDFEKDWTVKELTYAQAKGKRVQLLKLDSSPLDNIFLMEYGSKNNIDTNDPLQFNKLINDLRSWLGKPSLNQGPGATPNLVNLKVLANHDCNVFIDCEDKGVATAGRLTKISLAPGEYYAEFVNAKDPSDVISREIVLMHDKIEKVDFSSLDLVPYISNNKMGFANRATQEIIISCKYDYAFDFHEGLACVKLNYKYGYIDKSGKEVIPCKYDGAQSFSEGLARVYLNGKDGYIDKSGKEVIPCKYDDAQSFSEGLASVNLNYKYGYIDKSGKEVITCKYKFAYSFREGLALVRLNGKYGYIDKSGKEVIPCKYDRADWFCEGLALVELNGKYGYIDKSGKEVIPCKYNDADDFDEGLACVGLNGKYGYIDKSGKEVITCKYDDAKSFSEGLARVTLNGKDGYIDKSGKEVIPCKYNYAGDFDEGLACVGVGLYSRECCFIDIFGNEMFPENR